MGWGWGGDRVVGWVGGWVGEGALVCQTVRIQGVRAKKTYTKRLHQAALVDAREQAAWVVELVVRDRGEQVVAQQRDRDRGRPEERVLWLCLRCWRT